MPCRFCGGADGDGHLFSDCTWIREHPELHGLMEMDKSYWPRVFCGMVGYRCSLGVNGGSPWAGNPALGAGNLLECALGSSTSGLLAEWQLPVVFGAEGAAGRVAAEPDVWTDGGLVKGKVSGASSSGSGFFYSSFWSTLGSSEVGPS